MALSITILLGQYHDKRVCPRAVDVDRKAKWILFDVLFGTTCIPMNSQTIQSEYYHMAGNISATNSI